MQDQITGGCLRRARRGPSPGRRRQNIEESYASSRIGATRRESENRRCYPESEKTTAFARG